MSEQRIPRKDEGRDDPEFEEPRGVTKNHADSWVVLQRDLAKDLHSCGTVEDCLTVTYSHVTRIPGVDAAAVCHRRDGTDPCRVIRSRNLSADLAESIFAQTDQTVEDTSPTLVHTIVRNRGLMSARSADELSALGFPDGIVVSCHDDGVLALLVVASRNLCLSEGSPFIAMEAVAYQCAAAMGRAIERERHETLLLDRTRALEETNTELAWKRSKLELALQASRAGVSYWNMETGIIEMDSRIRELYGFPPDQSITSEHALERIHPDDRKWMTEEIASIQRPGGRDTFNHEFRIVHPEEGIRWISRRGRVERDAGGNVTHSIGISFDITPLKREENRLRTSEEKYRRLHESMMDAFACVDMEGRIQDCNPAFEQMLGYTRKELLEMNFKDFTHEKWHDLERRILDEQVLTRGFSDIYEKEYVRKDGTLLPVELRACALWDDDAAPCAIWGIVRDITERKRAEAAMREWNTELERRVAERTTELRQSEERFRKLAAMTAEGIAITEGGILLDGNPQLARMHGYELEEMIGRPVTDFIAPQSRSLVMEKIRDGVEEPYEAFERRKDGSVFPVSVHARMGIWEGRSMRATAIRDLSEAKRTAEQLRTQQTELDHARSLALVTEVSAGIVHQVAQPLSAMSLNIAAALKGLNGCTKKTCGSQEIVSELEVDVRRLREAVYHLRSLATPDRRNVAEMDFNEMVESVVRSLEHEALGQGVTIKLELDDRIPRFMGDRVQLKQVVINLLRNAFDACEPQEPGQRLIHFRTRMTAGDEIELEVMDSGMGIPEDILGKLFTPFFTTKAEGLGMGLRLAQTIVETHGGVIGGGNNPQRPGARFHVILPLRAE